MTIAQRYMTNISPKALMTFGYNVERFFPILADGRAHF